MITPALIQGLFVIALIVSVLGGLTMVIMAVVGLVAEIKHPSNEHWLGLVSCVGMALLGLVLAVAGVLVSRLVAESLIVVFRINETLTDILQEVKQRNGVIWPTNR
jgi:ABC-type Fe3+ transport system permease subunit